MDEWEYRMKKLILFLLIAGSCFAQGYDETIVDYTMFFLDMNEPYTIESSAVTTVINGDTSLIFAWENGVGNELPYITPNIGSYTAIVVVNDPSIWVSGSAVVTRDVIFPTGMYEVSLQCSDEAGYSSSHSLPFYLDIRHQTARIQINFRTL